MRALAIILVLVGLANASPLFDNGGHSSGRGDEEIYMTTVYVLNNHLIYIIVTPEFISDDIPGSNHCQPWLSGGAALH